LKKIWIFRFDDNLLDSQRIVSMITGRTVFLIVCISNEISGVEDQNKPE